MNKILLLEDDEALALGIEFTLKDEGYDVTRCAYVEDAIKAFNKEEFNIVILDVMLSDGSGYDVCKHIREKSEVPVIFLTACDDEVNVVLGLDIGGDDYITKPFRVRELISRIRAIQRRLEKEFGKKNILKCKDIVLYTENAKVEKTGEEITLSSQEYKLLLIFMTNPKKIMSREEILDKLIEGAGAYFDTNTLSVYIKRVREKIENDFSNPEYIKTKRGIGYIWNLEVQKE
ncbi:DNA-binding response OmpR family regulator [Clostridium tetanomorphum]|uniref:response regulator transcription factor n=1 Tax=Clostridium tetanomorphum TaxID=1553 RepID=UPI00044ED06F|nr:response regulator transcription factor [Clostridium tetanomorphum]KAJ53608.1 transcriptional regulator [Clostridium tetanomorphum DSM 665]MBP1864582.1 DNA-binding response OmpR family regulator [Clostridium tetanomorphum]NRS84051.1 DNA-binding response OmpR family regulator [Clostridium tetanomorphum]SQB92849.1 transcriptional regulator [Clostridium tetanomorphum]